MSGVKRIFLAGLLCFVAAYNGNALETGAFTFVTVRAALEDGLYDLAQKQAEVLVGSGDVSELQRGDAYVLLVRALYGQHRFKEMLQTIDALQSGIPTTELGALVYWHAVAQYQMGNPKGALDEISGFGTRFHGSTLLARVSRLEAWCYLKVNKSGEALAIFEQFDRQYGSTEEGAANLLDWGQVLLNSGDIQAARAVFERLVKRSPALSAVQEGRLWQAKALVAEGKLDVAWNILMLVANDQSVRADRRAMAWMTLSEVNAVQSNLEAAVTSASKSVDLAPTAYLKNRGRALWGRWLLRSGKIAEGSEMLRPLIGQLTDDPLSGELQLELAATYFGLQQFERAAQEYQYYLETFSDSGGRFQAFRGRGLSLWSVQRYAEASAMFEKAAGLTPDPVMREQLLVKSADSLFANSQYKLAAAAYDRVLTEYRSTSLTPQVLFQYADCLARQSQWVESETRFREVVRRFPDSALAERSLMRIAETKEEQGASFIHAALAAYTDVMNVYPSGALFPEALHRHGLAAYQIGEIDMALKDFTRVVTDFPKSRVAPQAYFMRGWALYMRGQEEESLKVCKSFVDRYPDSEWTSGVLFWIGEYAYNHGTYSDAEAQFLKLVEKMPSDPLADQALIWAGRSAMMQKEYLRAVDTFSRLAKAYPASTRLDEARFLQGDCLSELGEFSQAILVFDNLLAKFPGSTLVGAAWGRRGDCQFTLGVNDVKRYDEAVASYRSVARSPGITFDLELQAEYKIGRCFDKQGRRNEALEQYYTRVVVRYLAAKGPDLAAAVWFTKAAFAAADILVLEKNWKRAVNVLDRVVEARIPASGDARKRIEQIRAEHWLW